MRIIFIFIMLALVAVCGLKESKLTGLYKANNVYGRFTAYLALDFTMIGIAAVLSLFVPGMKAFDFPILLGLGLLVLGVLLYAMAFIKCPEPLKAMCIPSMIMSGIGVAGKICLFFLPSIWALALPNTSYAFDIPETGCSFGIPETIQDEKGYTARTQLNGDYIDIFRHDGSVDSIRREYVDGTTRMMDVNGHRYHWQ